jgi:hypothetical protein
MFFSNSLIPLLLPIAYILVQVEILINIVRNEITNPSLCIEVAENIQPLMKCVCDEEKKQLFQSDVHWENTVGLVLGRLSTALVSKNIESTHVLLKNEGEKVIRKMLQRDIKDAQHFQSTILSDLSRIVFHFKDGIPEDGMPMPNDTMFAYAFEAGLLQMCLKNLVRFSNTGNDEALMVSLDFILSGAIAVMFNDKSSKAIAKVYADVVLAVKEPDVRALEKNSKYAKVVKQVLHILGTNIESLNKTTDGAGHIICNTCKVNLEVEGRAIKRCGGCKKVTYCSVECQKADWKAHKEHCRKRIVDPSKHNVVNLGSAPLASHEKMAVHSENVLQAAQAVFNEGIIGWLKQANADGLNILDCLIIIDFREHLPHASVMTQEEFIGHDDYWGGVEPCPPQMKSFLKDHHAKMTKKGSLLAFCLTLPPRDKALASGRGSLAVTPAPFGGHFFPGGWPAYQASLR